MQERIPTLSAANFDWSLVRSFLAVLAAGSLTGAARATGILQPTLSRHIAELESQLGVTLFERTGRGLAPTEMASRMADVAQRMEMAAHAVVQTVVGQRSNMQGTVRIACSPMAASYLMPQILTQLGELEPTIQIELVASATLSNLLRREADIAIRMVRPEQQSLIARKLAELRIGVVANVRYLEACGIPAVVGDLLHHRLLGYDQDKTIYQGMASLGMPVTAGAFALRTDDQVAYARLVTEGAGIGFVPLYVMPAMPGVVQVLPQLAIPTVPVWLVVHREIADNRVIRRVYDFVGAAISQALQPG
ncbi:LysR family transcriptional regulator [Massilia antarctica]|uniref:LysR family transcriptional regulator n=1 Tax=Massilia antarctica TaxID=2765360 RepID=UPI00227226DF|nr:LysR family transcriptional regulator [Massilia sp. H27-R4]MCY0916329.1 LysR family transcriptional regulator [Massilia sp. H27-R4]